MKKLFILALALISLAANAVEKDGFSYKFEIEGIANDTVYLANYFGGKLYYNDTAVVDGSGKFEFVGNETKPGGIYAVILPDRKTFFEVVVTEPTFSAKTKSTNPEENITFKGSKENAAFYEYKNFLVENRKTGMKLQEKLKASTDDKEKEGINTELKEINNNVSKFQNDFFEKYDGLFIAKVMKAAVDPVVPEDIKANDSLAYVYYKAHYFDNVDMKDDRMLRSPILHNKIDYFLTKLTPQIPDSICSSAMHMTNLTNDDSEIFKYIVQYTTTTYEKSKVMGMDAVFVCMAKNYYLNDKAYWMDSTKLADVKERYEVLKNLTVGTYSDNITLMDTAGKWQSLYDVESEFTVLFFWDPNCGHCKKEVPKLKKFYAENKDKGVEVFAVCTDFETPDWKKFVKEKNLDFINVSDNPEVNKNAWKYIQSGETTLSSLNFRDYWDIFSTPQYYLLDKDKKIIAKRLNADQLEDFIQQKRAQQAK
ncbi:MAG: hypothetical protein CL843_00305 [Crocinitomicaceae bacterium]|nr:hypothetical protein [Crocinitomicaceae bacterium]|tara:strand:+ start:845 stop:2284 length:1440 start_codon:yes stop_codon:yes gene_type:complete